MDRDDDALSSVGSPAFGRYGSESASAGPRVGGSASARPSSGDRQGPPSSVASPVPQYLPPPPEDVEAEEVREAPRPTLTIRDALEAVRQTEPADLSTVVHHLTRMLTSRRPPRDLALIVFGMFAGRLGVARQLRDKGLSDALHGVSATDTLTAALAYLEDLAGGLQEDLPL